MKEESEAAKTIRRIHHFAKQFNITTITGDQDAKNAMQDLQNDTIACYNLNLISHSPEERKHQIKKDKVYKAASEAFKALTE